VADPIATAFALAVGLLTIPASPPLDPGPSPSCPRDMRLVTGTHFDEVQHYCTQPQRDERDTHCFAYHEGITAAEGPKTEIRVCMDQFEAPNQRGVEPYANQSFRSAEKWCRARHKRVCTEAEWETACESGDHRPWVYGWTNDKKICNSHRGWRPFDATALAEGGEAAKRETERLWQGAQSGTYVGCVSAFGIYDMMGNVEEWVQTRSTRKWPGALMGGFWSKPWTGCRGTNDAHEPTFTFYETGFRCCAAADTLDGDGRPLRKEPAAEPGE
jgi:formylglycine-generating enzyme